MLTSLYIHIPFCKHICTYCDFHKEVATLEKKNNYLNALIKEIIYYKEEYKNLKTIYIGGGTPSNFSIDQLRQLFDTLKSVIEINNVIEYSIEVNPDDVTNDLALLLANSGVNRVSMGVQTFNQEMLSYLRRTHNKEDVLHAISLLNKHQIDNISIDLMFSLPRQTEKEILQDINEVLALDVPHISYYSLILEEKSILYQQYLKGETTLNDNEFEAVMYETIIETLSKNKYTHYEISNFSKPGYESLHNKTYWTYKEYLGLGSGAHSLMGQKRFYHRPNVKQYINDPLCVEEEESVPLEDEVMMGLRLIDGIDVHKIEHKYNIDFFAHFTQLQTYIDQDLLTFDGKNLRLTKTGLLRGNDVFLAVMEG